MGSAHHGGQPASATPPPASVPSGSGCRQSDAPERGSPTEAWLKRWRDEWPKDDVVYAALDDLLDDYRLHADCGVSLLYEVPSGEGWCF